MAELGATVLLGTQAAPVLTLGGLVSGVATAGSVISAIGGVQRGNAERGAANFEAAQLAANANKERATAQRQAMEERRRAKLAQSRLTALAASSGASATDAGALDIYGDLAAEGEYRALSALYNGEDQARAYERSASTRRYEGRQARRASIVKSASTLLDRYG